MCMPEKDALTFTPKEETTVFFLWLYVKYNEHQRIAQDNAMLDLKAVADLLATVISCSTQATILKCAFEVVSALSCEQQVQQRLCQLNENRDRLNSLTDSSMGAAKAGPFRGTRTSCTQTHTSEDDIKTRLDNELNLAKAEMRKEILARDEYFEEVRQDYEEQMQTLQNETKHLRELLEARSLALNQSESLIAELRGTHSRVEQEAFSFKDKAADLERSYNQLQADFTQQIEENEGLQAELDDAKEQITISNAEREKLKRELFACQEESEAQGQEMKKVRQELDSLSARFEESEVNLSAMKEQNHLLEQENSM
ncbi:hypothetical protein K493DRAFT_57274 [Basidiobolus meristosporus CBS 931.73]|uniref:Uncharacterized protein n=1 Tax=Basidiobolus meristosporus CBS 931.73 TaxID=1314790 RepID=A0A1Y1XY50_9FUNG|nr:hypothetical protein K493DRAFT_57274 [Basidiobolus meristosporus CBS 931.73]|eukprot:ORX90677.1 hypothetical protein K493DRAFT_57274 [Basidiobolus meristosporus CBS 931.73]